ncbi:hypothetical protein ACTJK5_10585 [Agrobacterium sp. 22094]|uniref:hypothetical protein n=1 Tax=Agrobacterium sp. 22094 TaxID=3453872 RepID=UPI003F84F8E2
MQTATNIERFPIWAARAPAPSAQRVDWVCLGSEHDIAHIVRLWQLVMRFRLEDLPDDESIMWQLSDKLRGRRSDIVRIREADIEIDRLHLKDFRDQIDWLWDHLVDEHGEQRYQFSRDFGDFVRIESEQKPITDLYDARRAVDIITALDELIADNVIRIGG